VRARHAKAKADHKKFSRALTCPLSPSAATLAILWRACSISSLLTNKGASIAPSHISAGGAGGYSKKVAGYRFSAAISCRSKAKVP
jgi:hypothetical protein